MRAYLPNYQLDSVTTLNEALSIMEAGGRPLAGGTDLMVLFEAGLLPAGTYVDISRIKELQGIHISKTQCTLGALVTYSQIKEHPVLKKQFPILCDSAKEVGAVAIQNRGTIGGNIANASPAADFPPGLLVYDAKINLISKRGSRTIDYGQFHLGYKKSELQRDELIHSITIEPKFKGYFHFWRKVGSRKAQAISKTMIAGVAKTHSGKIEDIRIALGSVAPTAVRATQVETFLKGKSINSESIQMAKQLLKNDISPIDDMRSTGTYRRVVSQNILEEFLCGIG